MEYQHRVNKLNSYNSTNNYKLLIVQIVTLEIESDSMLTLVK